MCAAGAALACACGREAPARELPPAAPYRGPAARAPTNQLRVIASSAGAVVTRADSVVIRYRLHNDGTAMNVGDFPIFYRFRVYTPAGEEIEPRWSVHTDGWGGQQRMDLARGADGEEHEVNLACADAAPIRFGARFAPTAASPCDGWRLPAPGDYYVIVQHVPFEPPDGSAANDPAYLPSRADTVLVRYSPSP
ncbi:hypothetical protein [Longimicrobium sp.]|uniref:hypothetical protein n=1 Tax=Longimicrobium sp. TaxID=2029185 RepID=UPI002D808E18|nr:hypothetical protein [Longimicrobium sp.]